MYYHGKNGLIIVDSQRALRMDKMLYQRFITDKCKIKGWKGLNQSGCTIGKD